MKYYHVWFQTKFRRYILIDEVDQRIHELFALIAKEKNIKLVASGSLQDHMHLLVGLEDDQKLPWAVKMFKGISSRRIFQEFPSLKYDFRTYNFWARKYAAKEVLSGALSVTTKYILNQKKDLHVI